MELKHITRAEWVAALRSGKYKQVRSQLKGENMEGETGFCCLGVACDLAGIDWDLFSLQQLRLSSFAVRVDNASLNYTGKRYPALDLFRDLGLWNLDTSELAWQNDQGDPFELIADEIEALPVRVVNLELSFPTQTSANAKAR